MNLPNSMIIVFIISQVTLRGGTLQVGELSDMEKETLTHVFKR